ncbi:SDR family oxidoreductase [Gluconacetobacter tumulicola]|uniref:SDR family oxidoreductase n=1 Tax=Gluconacetobacter tumulicola TaxID=1017177 RepID=A0A7W4P7H0_9PROT|nr:SDR family oxidoreductase [Gluconacetobacter tumulicola]MBB2180386.1 SDR family oxidoreductase [Gluconacetobacter tumulicola]
MRVFVTGATGFIESAIVDELVAAGHEVTGLVRSMEASQKLEARGAKAHRGTIEDLDSLRSGAAAADGVIHTAFYHAFSHASLRTRLRVILGGSPSNIVKRFMEAAVEADRRAIEALGGALRAGSRPLITAFPTMAMTPGHAAVETASADSHAVGGLRARSEEAALSLVKRGVRAMIIRLPPSVHDETKQGLVTQLIATARKTQLSAYVEDGKNRWPAVHRLDAAHLFRLVLEKGESGARYHAVAEEGLPFRYIAEAIGRDLGVRAEGFSFAEAGKHFRWLAHKRVLDLGCGSGLLTQRVVAATALRHCCSSARPGRR